MRPGRDTPRAFEQFFIADGAVYLDGSSSPGNMADTCGRHRWRAG
jgi:hypothetical protein